MPRGIYKRTEYHRNISRMAKIGKTDERCNSWKGDNAGIEAIHLWVKKHLGKPSKCINPECVYPRKDSRGKIMLKPKSIQWANVDHSYKRNLADYMSLCASCHRRYDIKNNGYRVHTMKYC